MNRILVIRGVVSTDELGELGLAVANKYEQADMVALVKQNAGIIVKGDVDPMLKSPSLVEFLDANSEINRLANVLRKIRESGAGQISGEYAIGQFLFFWPIFGTPEVVIDRVQEGDMDAVEEAAEQFIRCDLGSDLSKLHADEHRDAAGHAADGASS